MKNILDKSRAFTLIEVLVVVAIIAILALGIRGFNFQRLSDAEHAKVLQSKIKNQLEETRNLALLGKGVPSGATTVNPEQWIINLNSSTGVIETKYVVSLASTIYNKITLDSNIHENFEIDCGITPTITPLDITFEGKDIKFEHCGTNALTIKVKYKNIEKNIYFDPVSGVISQD